MHHTQTPPVATTRSATSGAAWWHRAARCAGAVAVPAAAVFGAGILTDTDAATLAGGLTVAVTLPAMVFAEDVAHKLTAGGTR